MPLRSMSFYHTWKSRVASIHFDIAILSLTSLCLYFLFCFLFSDTSKTFEVVKNLYITLFDYSCFSMKIENREIEFVLMNMYVQECSFYFSMTIAINQCASYYYWESSLSYQMLGWCWIYHFTYSFWFFCKRHYTTCAQAVLMYLVHTRDRFILKRLLVLFP